MFQAEQNASEAEKRTDVKGRILLSSAQQKFSIFFFFFVVPIHSFQCTAVNSVEGMIQRTSVYMVQRYLEGHVKSKSHFIPEEKTTFLNSDICKVQASRC